MSPLPDGIRRAFRLRGRGTRAGAEVDDEVAFHLEMRTAELIARGLSPQQARSEAIRMFGDTNRWSAAMAKVDRERDANERRTEWLDDLRQDLHFAARAAARAPLFTLLAVLTLALGIGANAAVFGVFKSVLLDGLPYADAERLVRVYGHWTTGTNDRGPLSAGTVADIAERQRSFTSVASFSGLTQDGVLIGDGEPRVVKIEWVEPQLFQTLGVPMALGRSLLPEDAAGDTALNIVLTHSAWQTMFGGDRRAIGSTIRVNGISRTVVGILPRGFVGPVADAELYFPLNLQPSLADPIGARRSHWLGMVGRLRPGVSLESGREELVRIAADLAREYPGDNGSMTVTVLPIRDALVGDTRTPLLILLVSAGLVLLITCANLAGALLSRTLSRRKEFAVRVALGAGRGRLVRQLLTESTLLAIIGGAAGIALASVGLSALRGLALPSMPEYADLSLDRGALLVTAALAVLTGLAFGLAPALSVGRYDVQSTLREETRGASESRRSRTLRGLLVAGQIALSVSLLAGAGLLARSLYSMMITPLGFDARDVLAATVELPFGAYSTPEARAGFDAQLLERVHALPGVTNVAIAGQLPTRVTNSMGFTIEGAPPQPGDAQEFVLHTAVSDDYFRTLQIPLLGGRSFGPQDGVSAPQALIVSETMAKRYWPNGSALGTRLRIGPNPESPLLTVVGIAADVRNDPTRRDAEPMIYTSIRQVPWYNPILIVRTQRPPLTIAKAVQREVAAIDPGLPVHDVATMESLLAEGLAARRLPVVLMSAFGVLALMLASVGVYALFASMAAAREREFGVRVALGSSRRAIAALVLRQGAVWMALGLVGGAVGVALLVRALRELLYGVRPYDPVTLGGVILVLLASGALALVVPVRRATRVDPISVLR